jgi:signal transduction histidine kinase
MRYLFFALSILFSLRIGYGQVTSNHIRNYGPEITRSGEAILSATCDDLGVLFFAAEKGVMAYDGDSWHIIVLPLEVGAKSVKYDSVRQRLWVGGFGTFGYVVRDPVTQYRYVSLSDAVFKELPFKQVWQILPSKNQVTFMSNEGQFLVTDDSVIIQPITESFIYEIDGLEYFAKTKGPLSIRENGKLKAIWDMSGFAWGSVYQIMKLDDKNHLLFTPYDGVFVHHLPTHSVTPYKAPLSKLLNESSFYGSVPLNDKLIAVGTWHHGILITDLTGNVIDQISTDKGLLSVGVSDFVLDHFGKLWAATDNGISVLDLNAAWPGMIPKKPIPEILITSLQINHDSTLYWPQGDTNIFLNRRPDYLRIKFATPASEYLAGKEYVVRLVGYDTTWSTAINNNFREYYQPTNGTYTFQIKRADGNEESGVASLQFSIQEPWYAFLVDWGTYILMGLGILFLLIFATTSRLRATKKELTKLVEKKVKEIESHKQELLTINRSLTDTNEELDTFLYRSSHDLISPVKSIKGLLNLMRMSNEDQDTYINLMEDRVSRLEQILLEINSYVKNVKNDPVTSKFDLEASVQESWSSLEFIEGADKITCSIDIEKDLMLDCDHERLKMVISNLLANSIKYHNKNRPNPFIRFIGKRENEIVRIVVEDNGQGIKEEHLSRLFDMFYRANENSNGTGLGLFLVKKNVLRMNGTINIESIYTKGTKVEITLPC